MIDKRVRGGVQFPKECFNCVALIIKNFFRKEEYILMKNYKLDVVRYNNEDVIVTSGNGGGSTDFDLTLYPKFTYVDPTPADGFPLGKLHFYTYNPTTGTFVYDGAGKIISEATRSYTHGSSSGEVVGFCEHPETHTFVGGPLE